MSKTPIGIGDKVAFSAAFLRSISEFTGERATARGVVTDILELSPECHLAVVDWTNSGQSSRVNLKNLARVGSAAMNAD